MATDFLAGVGVRDITPAPELIDNSLHPCMTVRLHERGSPMRVKALALTFGSVRSLLLAVDLVSIGGDHQKVLRQAVGDAVGLNVEDIVVSASHSHSTPFCEPLDGPHPFFDLILRQSVAAAQTAVQAQRSALFGHATVHVVGASFNTRVPTADGGVEFSRDFRKGLASGRPIDPRLTVVRIDDDQRCPIAGWIGFAAHPACVIFDTPISAEYPGYLTDRLTALVDGNPPFLFGLGACGDVNCIPMFGTESDSQQLGHQLANFAAPVFAAIETKRLDRFLTASATFQLPLEEAPSPAALERDIDEVEKVMAALDHNPELVWVLGINCAEHWPVEQKKNHVRPLLEWAQLMQAALADGRVFPRTWSSVNTVWIINELGLVFNDGEPLVELGLALAAHSPLSQTLLINQCNGRNSYLPGDGEIRRGGYEARTVVRYAKLAEGVRPLPYALGAANVLVSGIQELIATMTQAAENAMDGSE